jgi:hypothetical protein
MAVYDLPCHSEIWINAVEVKPPYRVTILEIKILMKNQNQWYRMMLNSNKLTNFKPHVCNASSELSTCLLSLELSLKTTVFTLISASTAFRISFYVSQFWRGTEE